jgi:cardiolipin synthase
MSVNVKRFFKLNFANAVTFVRIGIVIPLFFLLTADQAWSKWLAVALFFLGCFTDYADGVIARNFNQVTELGKILDPIADKLLIGSTLLLLAGVGLIHSYHLVAGVIILCREFLVSGLREWLSTLKVSLPVTRLAKWKTTLQMIAIGTIMLGHQDTLGTDFLTLGLAMLWVSAMLTIFTGYAYVKRTIASV